jgi:RNA recognition motif-containing protein
MSRLPTLCTVYVGNIPDPEQNQDALFALLKSIGGTAKRLHILTDPKTGNVRDYAFCEFWSQADADNVIKRLNGCIFHGRVLKVSEKRLRIPNVQPAVPPPPPPPLPKETKISPDSFPALPTAPLAIPPPAPKDDTSLTDAAEKYLNSKWKLISLSDRLQLLTFYDAGGLKKR